MTSTPPTIRLAANDNVVVARIDLHAGDTVDELACTLTGDVPRGHKIAARNIRVGDPIWKLGQLIGYAVSDIRVGAHVHTHNCRAVDHDVEFDVTRLVSETEFVREHERRRFRGFQRHTGQVGTRNYIGVITTVNCAATVARQACMQMELSGLLAEYPNVDGIVPVIHTTGCGMAGDGAGIDLLRRTLFGYVQHPNFAAVLLVGLGCEVNQTDDLLTAHGVHPSDRLHTLTIQANHGTRQTISAITGRVSDLLPGVNGVERVDMPASELKLAVQCGGSDGYSTITANPALGAAADLLVRNGGTVILSETPEIHGSEHLLAARAQNASVRNRLVALMEWWKEYTAQHGHTLDNNPSPGNIAGGITTIQEKSLGATAKGGTTKLMDVVGYAERTDTHGLVFMDSPGYDPCSVTGQVAAGANVICFTTGRGSVFGNRPCPSIKIATSTSLFNDMPDDMDFNAGPIADGEATVEELGRQLFDKVLSVASGEKTKSEELGFGNDEFVPWQLGAVM